MQTAKLLTLEEVSDLLRTSPSLIKKLCRERQIPAVKIGKSWLFEPEELSAWIRGRGQQQS
jgi:excisionase family DNA binding protein